MARTETFVTMRGRVRLHADQRNSSRYSDADINDRLNLAITELYDLLVGAHGERYYENPTPLTFTTVQGQATYALPADFYKLSRICVVLDGSRERNLDRFVDQETDFTREVQKSWTVRLYYVQPATKLINDNDTFDGINGWEEWACMKAALALKQADEEDASVLAAMIADGRKRIVDMRAPRDKGQPYRVADRANNLRRPWWDYVMTNDAQVPRYQLKSTVVELREGYWP